MTGPEMLTYVKRVFKRSDKDTEIYECITDVVNDMGLRMFSDEMSTISSDLGSSMVEGDYTFDVPADFGHLTVAQVNVVDTSADQSYHPLRQISKAEYDRIYQDVYLTSVGNRNTGVPCEFAYYGGRVYIGPAVDSGNYSFKINYSTNNVTDIDASTVSVPFSAKYRNIVRDGVLERLYAMLENFTEADYWRGKYEEGLMKIIANDNNNREHFGFISYQR